MKTHTIETFKFVELSEEAQENALDANRDWNTYGAEWWDGVYDDAKEIGKILGITIEKIYFSGFCSQGDGACFEGEYGYAKGARKAIREYAPKDEELHSIADTLQEIQRPCFYGLYAYVTHVSHYQHSGCTAIDVREDEYGFEDLPSGDLAQCLREFMDWIYQALERECEYLESDEVVKESLIANEVEFTADGKNY